MNRRAAIEALIFLAGLSLAGAALAAGRTDGRWLVGVILMLSAIVSYAPRQWDKP